MRKYNVEYVERSFDELNGADKARVVARKASVVLDTLDTETVELHAFEDCSLWEQLKRECGIDVNIVGWEADYGRVDIELETVRDWRTVAHLLLDIEDGAENWPRTFHLAEALEHADNYAWIRHDKTGVWFDVGYEYSDGKLAMREQTAQGVEAIRKAIESGDHDNMVVKARYYGPELQPQHVIDEYEALYGHLNDWFADKVLAKARDMLGEALTVAWRYLLSDEYIEETIAMNDDEVFTLRVDTDTGRETLELDD